MSHLINVQIRQLMKTRRITQGQVSKCLGVSQCSISERLLSEHTFRIDDLIKLETLLGEDLIDSYRKSLSHLSAGVTNDVI